MKIGKIPNNILENIVLNKVNNSCLKRNEIKFRPSIGEDCSALSMEGELFVLSTDPITGAANDIGKLAVAVNINDIASSGCEAVAIMTTILLPPSSTEKDLETIINDINKCAVSENIEVIGGHTEITDAVTRPVISCVIIGKTHNKVFISTSGAKVGQDVVMTKFAGLEGSSIIAKDNEDILLKYLDKEIIDNAKALSDNLFVTKESKIAMKYNITSMHDVTEGGILGAAWEIAKCSNTGIEINTDLIPIKEETLKICNFYNINPFRLISSGCLLITTFESQNLCKELQENGINATVIGKITEKDYYIINKGIKEILTEPDSDELYKIKKSH